MVTIVSPIAIKRRDQRDRVRPLGALFKHQLHAPPPSCSSVLPPISRPSFSRARLRAVGKRLRQLAVEHHRDAVGDFGEFVEVLARHQHGGAAAARSSSAWRITAAAPASTPQVGWLTTRTAGFAQDFAADDEFLQIAAGQAGGFRIALGLAHVEASVARSTCVKRRGGVDEAMLHHAAGGVAGQQRVLRQLHARRGAVAEPLLRHERRAKLAPLR